jgi:hypothetical protein
MSVIRPSTGSDTRGRGSEADRARKVLFLDDDPIRAAIFLAETPEAVWVETVAECLALLEQPWDEVHLDHDLGGEHFVDVGREDCGMEVVRWLCLEPRPHLERTRFFVHSHNPAAASLMVWQIFAAGFEVEGRPFGASRLPPPYEVLDAAQGWLEWLRRLGRKLVGDGSESKPLGDENDPPPPPGAQSP